MESVKQLWSKFLFAMCRSPRKEALAEFLATLIFIVLGDGVMATIVLGQAGHNSSIASAFGWGLSLMVAISISGGVSGGHLNPAVTVACATFKQCSWKKMLNFIIAQYLGSFLAAGIVYVVYADAIEAFDNGFRQVPPEVNATAGIFSTYPQDFASIGSCFLDQVVGTALLLLVICACTDPRNTRMPSHLQPAAIGLGLTCVCLAFGHNCGAPLNPARDLGPRIFTAIAGWGVKVFSFRNYTWFLVPVVGPHVGAILGVLLYNIFISMPFKNYSEFLDEADSVVDVRVAEEGTTKQSLLHSSLSSEKETSTKDSFMESRLSSSENKTWFSNVVAQKVDV